MPPRRFVTVAVELAMMSPAQGNCELITDLAAKSAVLGEPQMMRVARLSPADQTGLLGDKAHVIAIANAPRFGVHEHSFVNRLGCGFSIPSTPVLGAGRLEFWLGDLAFGAMNGKAEKLGAKRLLDMLGIGRVERVLFSHPLVRPLGGIVLAANLV